MSTEISTTKADAAVRQCDVAIELLFADREPLAVRTLAAAAHGLFADLNDQKQPGSSWREKIIVDSGLPKKDVLSALNEAQNFLKHADRDPHGLLTFDERENDVTLFLITLECGQFGTPLSATMQVFQGWFFASSTMLSLPTPHVDAGRKLFPDLHIRPRHQQLAEGAKFLKSIISQLGSPDVV